MKSLVDYIRIAENEEKSAASKKMILQQDWATENCPLKIGDIVKCCGYTHKKKQMVVSQIRWKQHTTYCRGEFDWKPGWQVFGRVLRKDGSESLQDANFDDEQYAKSLEEKR